ncbi:alcohol dehydrogenase [Salmonella enterica subsp. enterica]|uniref:Alcohol dehydrogenase n=1 Tax=Salmonella enterica I TaxID=59201 RepID=A0A447N9E9_SALET|nr:alcohol dehydrogenase [Salmonella enterica subsp. enterica]
MAVTNVAELNALVERVKKAQREYASFTQEQVDKIFRAAALAAADARIPAGQNGRRRIRYGYRGRQSD